MSLRARLLLGVGASTAAALVLFALLVYRLERTALYDEMDRALRTRAQALSALVEQEANGIENDLGRSRMPAFSRRERPQYFQLWLPDGTVLERSQSLGDASLVPGPTSIRLPDGREGRQVTIQFAPRPDPDDPSVVPNGQQLTLAYAQDVVDIDASLARLRSVLLLAVIAVTAIVLAILTAVVSFGLRPVRALAKEISAIDPRKLVPLDRSPTPSELVPVRARLDELVQRLATAFARERAMTAELAHELRTPVTGLKVTLELALSREREPEAYRTALRECLAICDQTQRTVEALLVLSRLDAGLVEPARTPISLTELVTQTLPPFVRRAAQRGVTIDEQLAPCTLRSDPDLMQIVLNNLLDNAVRYVDEDGTIRVELDDHGALRVSNSGCTLGPSEARQATSRFWRGDTARTGAHAGLGLSLANETVALLGGTLELTAERGGRFTATVMLAGDPVTG
jgi:signal transduction histidine kinase